MQTAPSTTPGGIDGNLGFPPFITRERCHHCRRRIRRRQLESTKKAVAKTSGDRLTRLWRLFAFCLPARSRVPDVQLAVDRQSVEVDV